jgi:chromosome segregation ATPase
MSKVFDALNMAMAQTAPTFPFDGKSGITAGFAATLAEELAQIETVIGKSIGKLKAAALDEVNAASAERAQTEQLIEELKTTVRKLQNELQETDRTLQSRHDEIDDLTTKLALLTKQAASLEDSLQQAKADVIIQTQRGEVIAADAKARIVALEARLVEAESTTRAKEALLHQLKQTSQARVAQRDAQLKEKEQLLAERDEQMDALQAEMSRLKDGVREMASFFSKRAEALTDDRSANRHAAPLGEPANPFGAPPPPQATSSLSSSDIQEL